MDIRWRLGFVVGFEGPRKLLIFSLSGCVAQIYHNIFIWFDNTRESWKSIF